MTDPRTLPSYKQTRYEDKHLLFLGAILDELKRLNAPAAIPVAPPAPPPAPSPAPSRRSKGS